MTVYYTPADEAREQAVADVLARCWHCEIHRLPRFEGIDFYAVRGDRIVAWIELKNRGVASDRFSSVYLSHVKWSQLVDVETRTGRPGMYVVAFTDCVKAIRATHVDVSNPRMYGNSARQVKEPIYFVPIDSMRTVTELQPANGRS
jgi:hypothetical protein